MFVGWLLDVPALVYLRDGSAQTRCTCCHSETEVEYQTVGPTLSPYTDTRPTSLSADPISAGVWQGQPLEYQFISHWDL